MKKLSFCFLFTCLVVSPISARDTVSLHLDTFVNKIHLRHQGDSIRFTPELRPLIQVPGGRRPFYAYLWDFGDGHFSTEPEPIHRYKEPGDYEVSLYAVNNYDDGPRPKRTKRPVRSEKSLAYTPAPSIFEQNFFTSNGVFQLFKRSDAKPGEDISLVIGVNSEGKKGRIYILSNEKVAGLDGFRFAGQSSYYNERIDTLMVDHDLPALWASVQQATFTRTGSPDYGIQEVNVFQSDRQAVSYFQELYGAYNSLTSYEIDPAEGDTQFSLINLDVTEEMLVDTNAIVTITGVFIPEDGIANVHQIDIPVVKSHDPNKMSIRPARMNYRFQTKRKTLTYKVQFQNDGEGDAKNVRLEMFLPEEVRKETFQLQALYPQCDTCETESSRGCYRHYIREDGALVFHFKDIALPGTGASDITDVDSTKGFILFTVETDRKLKNKSFGAYTDIYFDNNPPITTNTATARFRRTLSPILTLGSSVTFGTPEVHGVQHRFKPGFQMGIGLAPTAPYRKLYWQAELYTSYYSQSSDFPLIDEMGAIEFEQDGRLIAREYHAMEKSESRRFLSMQLPVQLRYNFNAWLSAGVGISLRKDFDVQREGTITYHLYANTADVLQQVRVDMPASERKHSAIKANPFFDINIGRTYLGPALGIRGGLDKDQELYTGIYGIWRF